MLRSFNSGLPAKWHCLVNLCSIVPRTPHQPAAHAAGESESVGTVTYHASERRLWSFFLTWKSQVPASVTDGRSTNQGESKLRSWLLLITHDFSLLLKSISLFSSFFQRQLFRVDRCWLQRCLFSHRADMSLGLLFKTVKSAECNWCGVFFIYLFIFLTRAQFRFFISRVTFYSLDLSVRSVKVAF